MGEGGSRVPAIPSVPARSPGPSISVKAPACLHPSTSLGCPALRQVSITPSQARRCAVTWAVAHCPVPHSSLSWCLTNSGRAPGPSAFGFVGSPPGGSGRAPELGGPDTWTSVLTCEPALCVHPQRAREASPCSTILACRLETTLSKIHYMFINFF